MILKKDGTLALETFDFEHIQGHIDEENMTLQKAVEEELSMCCINPKEIYSVESTFKEMKNHMELYSKIVCEFKTGRKPIK